MSTYKIARDKAAEEFVKEGLKHQYHPQPQYYPDRVSFKLGHDHGAFQSPEVLALVRALKLYKAEEDKYHVGEHIWESAATEALQAWQAAKEESEK